MSKKLKRFYRISSVIAIILILCSILVKVFIWTAALKQPKDGYRAAIHNKYIYNFKYTTDFKSKLFENVKYLLRPAIIILFVIFTVRLVKTPDIFEEKK